MFNTKWILTGALLALAALGLVLAPTEALAAKKTTAQVRGYIVALGSDTVTVQDATSGEPVTVTVNESTRIHKNNVEGAAFGDLAIGDKAKVRYNYETMVAKRIQAKSRKAQGEISAVDLAAKSVTIQPLIGEGVTVFVTDETIIKRDGDYATLEELVVGDRAKAKYDPVTMEAVHVHAHSN